MADIVISGNTSGSVTLRAPDTSGSTVLTLPTSSGTLVVTGGAQTVQFAAGSAASPSITFTGDTNTGIFSPAADTIAFTEGGVESMRIDSSGNVGIGTSNPARTLDVNGNMRLGTANGRFIEILNASSEASYISQESSAELRINQSTNNSNSKIAFLTQGTERMRITSDGNLLVGGTTSRLRLTIRGLDSNAPTLGTASGSMLVANSASTSEYGMMFGVSTSGFGWIQQQRVDGSATSYDLLLQPSGGNVCVASTTANAKFSVGGSGTFYGSEFNSGTHNGIRVGSSNDYYWEISREGISSGYLSFFNRNGASATERMRITPGGDLLIGATADQDQRVRVTCNGASPQWGIKVHNTATTGNNQFIEFGTEAGFTARGSITYNRAGGTTSFNTTSDYRLKENIIDLPNALQTVSKLKPRQFDWKETGNTTTGFIAHELAEVLPHAVTGEKDAVDKNGSPKYQGIDTSFLVATLTAAIQELNAKVEAQAAEIAALKGAN